MESCSPEIILRTELSLNQSPDIINCRIELSLKPPLISGHPLESVRKWFYFFLLMLLILVCERG